MDGKIQLKDERAGAIACRLIKIGHSNREPITITGMAARKSSFLGSIVCRKWMSDRLADKKKKIDSSSLAGFSKIPTIFMVKRPARDAYNPGSSRENRLHSCRFRLSIEKRALSASEYQRSPPAMQDNKIITEITPRIGSSI